MGVIGFAGLPFGTKWLILGQIRAFQDFRHTVQKRGQNGSNFFRGRHLNIKLEFFFFQKTSKFGNGGLHKHYVD